MSALEIGCGSAIAGLLLVGVSLVPKPEHRNGIEVVLSFLHAECYADEKSVPRRRIVRILDARLMKNSCMIADMMEGLSAALLAKACRIYGRFAYPDGIADIPPAKRPYFEIRADQDIHDFLPPAALADNVGQVLCAAGGGARGYSLRLGCSHHVHLKLKLQLVDFDYETLWVFMVDTHDKFAPDQCRPPDDHPDAPAWHSLQAANRRLKEQIENAWDRAGIVTFKGLLCRDLDFRPAGM